MKLNHIHIRVRDLAGALAWLDKIWAVKPSFQNERMASVSLDPIVLIVEKSDKETDTIIGFESEDCDRDFHRLVERGAVADAEPSDKPWVPEPHTSRGLARSSLRSKLSSSRDFGLGLSTKKFHWNTPPIPPRTRRPTA